MSDLDLVLEAVRDTASWYRRRGGGALESEIAGAFDAFADSLANAMHDRKVEAAKKGGKS